MTKKISKPLTTTEEIWIAGLAVRFFDPSNYCAICGEMNQEADTTRIHPFSINQFFKWLGLNGSFENVFAQSDQITILLHRLENALILSHVGGVYIEKLYYTEVVLSRKQREGTFWLSSALGAPYIRAMYEIMVVAIIGYDKNGDEHVGTGLLIDCDVVLTCAHVLTDMSVDRVEQYNGSRLEIKDTLNHELVDVGLIYLSQAVDIHKGLAFLELSLSEQCFTLGYPSIPLSRSNEVVLQGGEVVNSGLTTIHGERVFLYSAIARPGNSGGPVISRSGYVIGIVSKDLRGQDSKTDPFYSGVSSIEIARCVNELDSAISFPFETYE